MTEPLENKFFAAVHSVEPAPDFSDKLWGRISSRPQPNPAARRVSPWVWIPSLAVLALTLVVIIATPQAVLASFRSLIAYLPGIGFVQNDGGTLYLPQPVTVEQDGVSLTIEQVVADADKTVVSYHIDGLPTGVDGAMQPCFYDDNNLLLADGATRRPTGGSVLGYEARVEFQPLPAGVSGATLVAGMNFPDPACTAPREWKVDFSLGTTPPPETEMLTVIENPTPQPTPLTPTNAPVAASNEAGKAPEIKFIVDRVALLENGYLVHGYSEYSEKSWLNAHIDDTTVFALDASGQNVPLEASDEGSNDNEFAYKILTKDFSAPLTLHVKNMSVWADVEASTPFTFEAGANPQVGQSWDINKELEIAGLKIQIGRAGVVQEADPVDPNLTRTGYAVEYNTPNDLDGYLWCTGGGKGFEGGGSSGKDLDGNRKEITMFYPDGLPTGQVTCSFRQVQFLLPGDWQFEWQPPAAEQ